MNKTASTLQIMKMLWGALLISIGFYVFIVLSRYDSDTGTSALFLPLTICATISSLIGYFFAPILFKIGIKLLPNDAPKENILRTYFVGFIIRLALFESVAIYGLFLGLQGAKMQSQFFFIAAVLLFLKAFPSEKKILEKAKSFKNFTGLL